MRRIITLIVIVALWAAVAAYDCNANLSGDNNASPARMYRSSSSCNANLSGDNNAAPARMFNNAPVCSGKGGCVDGTCVCNSGYQGENCEHDCTTATPAPTTVAPTTVAPTVQLTPRPTVACPPCPCGEENLSGDNNASPARRLRDGPNNGCPTCKACPTTVAPTTAAPTTTVAPTTVAPTVQLTPRPTVACPPCPCGEENLSGDNNASPARRLRDGPNNGCPTCKACPTTVAPTTAAPATTVAPTVQLTPRPTTAAPQTTGAPTVGLPYCDEANLSGDNNASPARKIKSSSSCNVNLSGDNNASPARRFRNAFQAPVCSGKGGCVEGTCVCNVGFRGENCEIQYCVPRQYTVTPTTAAPATTVAPTVQLTPRPTCPLCPCGSEENLSGDNNASPARAMRNGGDMSCPTCKACPTTRAPTQNESGDDNSRESSSATKIGAFAGIAVATIVSMLL